MSHVLNMRTAERVMFVCGESRVLPSCLDCGVCPCPPPPRHALCLSLPLYIRIRMLIICPPLHRVCHKPRIWESPTLPSSEARPAREAIW